MEVVIAIALAAATGLLVTGAGGRAFESVAGALAQLVGGYRPDGWPTGVQEEDRDRPWGRAGGVARANLPSMPGPPLTRVRPTVHPRLRASPGSVQQSDGVRSCQLPEPG